MMDCENTPSSVRECVTVHRAILSHTRTGEWENGVTELPFWMRMGDKLQREKTPVKRRTG